ncbi:hypothetical protein V8C44DRAFT_331419 [Trichoderma aethiopicum]
MLRAHRYPSRRKLATRYLAIFHLQVASGLDAPDCTCKDKRAAKVWQVSFAILCKRNMVRAFWPILSHSSGQRF